MINNLNNINNMNNKPACDTCMNTTMGPIKPKKNRITINISSLSTTSSDDSSEAIVPPVSTQSHTICCGECECLPEEKIGYYYRNRERKLEYQKKYNKEQGDKIKNYNKDKKRVAEVIAFVKNNNGLAYAENKMVEFQQEALSLLQNFEDSEYKDALTLMVNYVIERKK